MELTEIVPFKKLLGNVTEIELLPCPVLMITPEGTNQLNEVPPVVDKGQL